MRVQSLGQEDSLEKEMATHSNILAGKIPWTEEPGGLQSMGLRKVRHDLAHIPGAVQQKEKVIVGVEFSACSLPTGKVGAGIKTP